MSELTRQTVRCSHGFVARLCTVPSCPHYGALPKWEQNARRLGAERNRQRRARLRNGGQ